MSSNPIHLSTLINNTAQPPISAEAQSVRDALLEKGLETPIIDNGLSAEEKYQRIHS